jgi:plastocyanin
MRRKGWIVGAALVLAGCGSTHTQGVQEVIIQPDAAGVQHVQIRAHSYWFEPNRIVLKINQKVELKVDNDAFGTPHNLTCNAAEAGMMFSTNMGMFHGKGEVTFTPTRVGEYEFYCHVGEHAKHGMKGVFVVVN